MQAKSPSSSRSMRQEWRTKWGREREEEEESKSSGGPFATEAILPPTGDADWGKSWHVVFPDNSRPTGSSALEGRHGFTPFRSPSAITDPNDDTPVSRILLVHVAGPR